MSQLPKFAKKYIFVKLQASQNTKMLMYHVFDYIFRQPDIPQVYSKDLIQISPFLDNIIGLYILL